MYLRYVFIININSFLYFIDEENLKQNCILDLTALKTATICHLILQQHWVVPP